MDTGSLARDAEREGGLDKALKGGKSHEAALREVTRHLVEMFHVDL